MSQALWMAWTFVLGAMPGFLDSEWVGPVITGPMESASVTEALAVLLLMAAIREHRPASDRAGLAGRLLIVLGVMGTVVWASLVLGGYIFFHPLVHQISEQGRDLWFNLMGALRMPSEALALVGWSILTLRRVPATDGAPGVYVPLLYLVGAVVPCALLVLGCALPNRDLYAIRALDIMDLATCLASGGLLCTALARIFRTGMGLMDVIALLAGFGAFRAVSEAALPFVWTFTENALGVGLPLVSTYLLLVFLGYLVLWRASRLGLCNGADRGEPERESASPMPDGLFVDAGLTDREREVVQDTLQGMTSQQIAQRYGLSPSTVGTYRRRAYEKLGVANKREFVELVTSGSLLDEGESDGDGAVVETKPGGRLSSRGLVVAVLAAVLLIVFAPPGYVPLSVAPYGLRTDKIAPNLVGNAILVGGIARWLRARGTRPSCETVADASHEWDARLRVVATASGTLAAGWVVSLAWLYPFPGLGNPVLLIDWAVQLLWPVFGLGAALMALGAFLGRSGGELGVLGLLMEGLRELLLNRPYHVALFGVGMQCFALEGSMFSSDWLVWERYQNAFTLIPHVLVVLIVGLVGIRVLQYRDTGDEDAGGSDLETRLMERGLSKLQAKVVVLTLEGKKSDEIASALYLAPGTVRVYRSRACKVLGVNNLSELEESEL